MGYFFGFNGRKEKFRWTRARERDGDLILWTIST